MELHTPEGLKTTYDPPCSPVQMLAGPQYGMDAVRVPSLRTALGWRCGGEAPGARVNKLRASQRVVLPEHFQTPNGWTFTSDITALNV